MYHQDIVFWFRVENAMLSAVLLLKVGAEDLNPPQLVWSQRYYQAILYPQWVIH